MTSRIFLRYYFLDVAFCDTYAKIKSTGLLRSIEMPIVSEEFAKRLKKMRTQRGYSQEALGKSIDTTKAAISRFELHKTRKVSDLAIDQLAKTLNVNKEWLLGETDQLRGYQNSESGPVNDDESEILNTYRNLNENGKNLAKSQLEEISKVPSLSSRKARIGAEFAPDNLIAASGSENFGSEEMEALQQDIEMLKKLGEGRQDD